MKRFISWSYVVVLLALFSTVSAFAQKVTIGYDKGANFSRYKSYTWTEPSMPPARPLLYATVVGTIEHELRSKGLSRTDSDGDLILIPVGGLEFGLNSAAGTPILSTYSGPPPAIDATMWTGAGGSSSSMTTLVPKGGLTLNFVDRSVNKVVWTGNVTVNLDIEKKKKSLELVDKAITKLLKDFPPNRK